MSATRARVSVEIIGRRQRARFQDYLYRRAAFTVLAFYEAAGAPDVDTA